MVRRAEARYHKVTADYHFHTAAQEHPELSKNYFTRYWQKQRLRRQYQKQAKEAAKQSAEAAGKTATATENLTARAVEFVKRHPVGAVIALLCVLLLLFPVLFVLADVSGTPGPVHWEPAPIPVRIR